MTEKAKLGVVVNPIAGIGGRVGLKGSDGPEVLRLAIARGARSEAASRTLEALRIIAPLADRIEILTWPGPMGADICGQLALNCRVGGSLVPGPTSGADTEAAARWMLREAVDLLLFVGGDGTARNICTAVDEKIPALGVPAGVKIHSAVFAVTPRSAGVVARRFLEQSSRRCRPAEVLDIDEDAFRDGRVCARLFGSMCVPVDPSHLQGAKVGGSAGRGQDVEGIASTLVELMQADPDGVYLIGPGTTMRAVKERLGIEGTLLGVDVIYDGKLVAKDADERTLIDWVTDRKAYIIVTIIGGQGHLFGRGNQQISPEVIRRVGLKNIIVAATAQKLIGLGGKPLLVDTGDADLDRQLKGHLRVIIGYRNYTLCPVQ